MDTGLFIIILVAIASALYVFNRILDFITYKPKHIRKTDEKCCEFWGDKND